MKIAVISDIHIDEQADQAIFEDVFSQCLDELDIDCLLIAGDISEYYLKTLAFIKRLRERLGIEIYFCPGNHDIWSKFEPHMIASDIIDYMKGQDGDQGCIHNEAVFLTDKTVLIGSCGWYDYSFAYPGKFSKEQLSKKFYMTRRWQDSLYAKLEMEDGDVDRKWNEELGVLLDKYSKYDIVFMTHMVNHPSFLVGKNHPKYEMFKYFNGFLGSEGLHQLTRKKNVKFAISGHVHYRRSFEEEGIYYMCRCLGYPKEFSAFGGDQGLREQILESLEIIEVK